MYANGGTGDESTPGLPSITLEDNTKIRPLNSGSDDLTSVAFGITTPSTPNNFVVQGWRELYNDLAVLFRSTEPHMHLLVPRTYTPSTMRVG